MAACTPYKPKIVFWNPFEIISLYRCPSFLSFSFSLSLSHTLFVRKEFHIPKPSTPSTAKMILIKNPTFRNMYEHPLKSLTLPYPKTKAFPMATYKKERRWDEMRKKINYTENERKPRSIQVKLSFFFFVCVFLFCSFRFSLFIILI